MANELVTTKSEQPIEKISAYLYKQEIITKFSDMLGEKQAQRFVASVLTAVMAEPKLQSCTPQSVYLAAVRSATLGLSVDPAYGQAYLIAIGNVCNLWPGYKGFRDKASENGIACHVDEIYDNEKVLTNRLTGEVRIEGENGFWRPASTEAWSDGHGHKVAGFIASWWNANNPKTGEKQYHYMTNEQIEDYAKEFSPASYKSDASPWNKNKLTRKEMFKKTVLKILLRKTAPLNPVVSHLLVTLEDDQSTEKNDAFDGIDIKGTEVQEEPNTQAENLSQLGFDEAWDFTSPDIIAIVMKEKKLDKETATQCLVQAHKNKKIGDKLTVADAKAFAKTINA